MFNHWTLPDYREYFVFNEDWENVNETGQYEALLKYPYDPNDPNAAWKLHDIISVNDSRYDNIFASAGYSYSWDKNGVIKINTGSGYTSTTIDRNWDNWNYNWFKDNTRLGPYDNK